MTPPAAPLRIIILDDSQFDAELIEAQLRRDDVQYAAVLAGNESELVQALRRGADAVIADFSLPSYDALRALDVTREVAGDIPFVLVSGSISEELMVEVIRRGADDYLTKDRLTRLSQALQRAFSQRALRKERLAAEAALRLKEEQLQQSQRVESIGRLAGGIAHDFNNLLTAIFGNGELALQNLPNDSPAREPIEQIINAAKSAAKLTRQLLAFGRRQVMQPRVIDVNFIVPEFHRVLRRVIPENIELVLELQPGLAAVVGDPTQIEQVLMNLVVNARDAMPAGGRVVIRTHNAALDGMPPTMARIRTVTGPADWVALRVKDNGEGIPGEIISHIFEPFFTTKSRSLGSGLGLSTVHGIVHQSNGHVVVDSSDRGTEFVVLLPATREAPVSAPSTQAPPAAPKADETILLVEDDDAIRRLSKRSLLALGYRVLDCGDAQEALRIAQDHKGRIHLLVTDVVMPGMQGPALAAQLRRSRPDLRVLFVSGYAEEPHALNLGGAGISFLPKPFSLQELEGNVRRAIGSSMPPGAPATSSR